MNVNATKYIIRNVLIHSKREAKSKRSEYVLQYEVIWIAKQYTRENQETIDEDCVWNDSSTLTLPGTKGKGNTKKTS